jgi:hypothetical protein
LFAQSQEIITHIVDVAQLTDFAVRVLRVDWKKYGKPSELSENYPDHQANRSRCVTGDQPSNLEG